MNASTKYPTAPLLLLAPLRADLFELLSRSALLGSSPKGSKELDSIERRIIDWAYRYAEIGGADPLSDWFEPLKAALDFQLGEILRKAELARREAAETRIPKDDKIRLWWEEYRRAVGEFEEWLASVAIALDSRDEEWIELMTR